MTKLFTKLLVIICGIYCLNSGNINAQRQMEKLDRGVVAVKVANGVFISWRIFGNERSDISYNIYRDGVKINTNPITGASNYLDNTGNTNTYQVAAIVKGVEKEKSASASVWNQNYINIPLQIPAGGTTPASEAYNYSPSDCSVGDMDGDGQYEIVVKWEPSNAKDNSQAGYTGPVMLDAYKLNGTRLWRINLGINIRAGAHYTQFMVFDLDGDGKAEVACKTADGTTDGAGTVIGNGAADYRNTSGYILNGPEFFTIFNGETGVAMATVNYDPPRGIVDDWGDGNGNRVDRFLACIAYLDGSRPSVVMCRGYYTRAYLAAWDWRNGTLTKRWAFDSNTSGNGGYYGQGNHNVSVADVDNDGKDEIIYGACTIDDNGTGKYTTGLGHGDAMHVGDLDPDRPGLETWSPHETATYNGNVGASFRDARNGSLIWKYIATGDIGRGMAGDVDATHKGAECWAAGSPFYNSKGAVITGSPSSTNFRIFWDGDDLEELLNGNSIYKHNVGELLSASGCLSNNGTKSTPALSADLFGDWREEVMFRTIDNSFLRIYTSTAITNRRMYTLMHDKEYRNAIAWQNVAYNQPPHLGFYLAADAGTVPPTPILANNYRWKGNAANNTWDAATANWSLNGTDATYSDGDSVLFDFTGVSSVPVVMNSTFQPAAVTVFSTSNYIFEGTGDLAGDMMLVKSGSGKLTLNNKLTYTGITDIWDGALIINDTLVNSAVVVRGGVFGGVKSEGKEGGRVGGSGVIKAGVTLANKGCVSPGNDFGSPDTLTIENFLIEKGTSLNLFDLSDDPTGLTKANDFILVKGNLAFSDSVYFCINKLNTTLTAGEYVLFQYTGTFTGNVSKITTLGIPGIAYTIENKNNTVVLKVAEMRTPSSIIWTGAINNVWDLATTANWEKNELPDIFVTGDTILFADNSPANTSINVSNATTTVGKITVEGTSNFTFSGTGSIIGTGGITKTGPGKLTLNNTNGFTGGVSFTGGSLEIATLANGGIASSIGAGTSAPASFVLNDISVKYTGVNATSNRGFTLAADTIFYEVNSGKTITISGAVAGAGKLQKIGSGTLGLSGSNTFSGGTIIKTGTVQLGEYGGAILGLGSGPVILEGGTLSMSGASDDNGSSNTFATNIVVPAGYTGTLIADGRCDLNGSLSGDGNLTLFVPFVRTVFYGSWVSFMGTVNLTTDGTGGECRLANASYNYSNTSFNLAAKVTLFCNIGQSASNGAQSVNIGALSGVSGAYLAEENWTIGAKNTNTTFAGIISGNSVTKTGTGILTLSNANTYAGGTTINGGSILATNTTGSATGTGNVAVNNTGTLTGTGIISGAVTVNNGGTLAPGNMFGTLTVNNNVSFQPGGKWMVDLISSSGVSDKLSVNSAYKLNLNGGTLEMTNLSTSAYEAGNTFTLAYAAKISGTLAAILPSTPGAGLVWDTTQLRSGGIIKVITDPGTGVPLAENKMDVLVYPSPTKGDVTITLSNTARNMQVKVINSLGKLVYSKNETATKEMFLNLDFLPGDVYIIQITTDGKILQRKIVKE